MSKKSPAVTKLRSLLHGVLSGDPEAERQARDLLYGEPPRRAPKPSGA